MGLPLKMENLNAPTVPSGPSSGAASSNGIQTNGLSFAELQAKKDNIEAEMSALSSVLDSVCSFASESLSADGTDGTAAWS